MRYRLLAATMHRPFLDQSPTSRVASLLRDSDYIATRLTLALAELMWALTLAWPGDTFGRPTYDYMSRLMGETSWAYTFLITGLAQLAIAMIGDCRSRYATAFAAWNATLWVSCTVAMYLSVYPPPAAISGETALAFAAATIFVRSFFRLRGAQ